MQLDPFQLPTKRRRALISVSWVQRHALVHCVLYSWRDIRLALAPHRPQAQGRAYYLGRIELTEDPSLVLKGAEVVPGMQAMRIPLRT